MNSVFMCGRTCILS